MTSNFKVSIKREENGEYNVSMSVPGYEGAQANMDYLKAYGWMSTIFAKETARNFLDIPPGGVSLQEWEDDEIEDDDVHICPNCGGIKDEVFTIYTTPWNENDRIPENFKMKSLNIISALCELLEDDENFGPVDKIKNIKFQVNEGPEMEIFSDALTDADVGEPPVKEVA